MNAEGIRLTELSSCAGCAAKLGAAELRGVMERVSPATNARVLVGYGSCDDAGVYELHEGLALVQTVDFFPPIVNDPYDFGRIAATNALSDIYAMGAVPISALNIAAFPEDLDLAILVRILEGGSNVARSAGVAILGGHTIKDAEPKYGMAVTGVVDPRRMITNAGAIPGDVLVLTKPLGTGILTTALRRDAIEPGDLAEAIAAMTTLNEGAALAMQATGVSAATDVTGFGLLGHAENMARASTYRLADSRRRRAADEGRDRADRARPRTRRNAEQRANARRLYRVCPIGFTQRASRALRRADLGRFVDRPAARTAAASARGAARAQRNRRGHR